MKNNTGHAGETARTEARAKAALARFSREERAAVRRLSKKEGREELRIVEDALLLNREMSSNGQRLVEFTRSCKPTAQKDFGR